MDSTGSGLGPVATVVNAVKNLWVFAPRSYLVIVRIKVYEKTLLRLRVPVFWHTYSVLSCLLLSYMMQICLTSHRLFFVQTIGNNVHIKLSHNDTSVSSQIVSTTTTRMKSKRKLIFITFISIERVYSLLQ